MLKTDSIFRQQESLKQNIRCDHANTQQDGLLHFYTEMRPKHEEELFSCLPPTEKY